MILFRRDKPRIEMALLIVTAAMLAGVLGSLGYAYALSHQVTRALKVGEAPEKPDAASGAAESAPATSNIAMGAMPMGPMPGRGGPPVSPLPAELKTMVQSKRLFGAPNTAVQVQGVLGDSALVNSQWMKVGEDRGGIKVIEIAGGKVTLEVFGERREVSVWPDMGSGQPVMPMATPAPWDRGRGGPRNGSRGGPPWGGGPPQDSEEFRRMRDQMRRQMESGNFNPQDMQRMRDEMMRSFNRP